jgi:hypothetical protein
MDRHAFLPRFSLPECPTTFTPKNEPQGDRCNVPISLIFPRDGNCSRQLWPSDAPRYRLSCEKRDLEISRLHLRGGRQWRNGGVFTRAEQHRYHGN